MSKMPSKTQIEMLREYLCSHGNGLARRYDSVGLHLKSKLVVIRNVSDTGVLDRVVCLIHGSEDRVGVNYAQNIGSCVVLVLFSRNISTAVIKSEFHIEML